GAVDQGGLDEQTVATRASLSLVTIASPNVTLPTGPGGTVKLTDTAFLSGGESPTGNIDFTLTGPGGFLYTQTVAVTANATSRASTRLPPLGIAAATYTCTAPHRGALPNTPADDQGGLAERTVVSPASPTIVTTASPNVTLPAGPPGMVTLSDSAFLLFG